MSAAPARRWSGPEPDALSGRRRAWTLALDAVVLLPLVAAVVSPASRTASSAINLSAGLGLVATSTVAVVLLLVSRVRGLTRVLGLELGNHLHRRLGIAALSFTCAHVAAAVSASERGWALLGPVGASPTTLTAIAALVAMALCATVLVPRTRSRRYAVVARLHGLLAVLVLVLVGAHVVLLDRMLADPLVAVPMAALGTLVVAIIVRRWVVRPLLDSGAYSVVGVRPEGPGTSTLVLFPAGTRRAPVPEPGQFMWLRLRRDAVTGAEHPFTIAASSRSGALELTFRDRGAFTRRLGALEPGRRVWLDGPHGDFVPSASMPSAVVPPAGEPGLVLVAGGVGITPIMSILRAHAAAGDPRAHRLLLAERPGEGLFATELDVLARRLDLAVTRTGGRRLDTRMLAEALPTPVAAHHEYFVCGPPRLVAAALGVLDALAVPPHRVHTEQFA